MSVTISVKDAQTSNTISDCTECNGRGLIAVTGFHEELCQNCIDGKVHDYQSDCREINLVNGNAAAILDAVSPGSDTVTGEWRYDHLPVIQQRIMILLNTKSKNNLVKRPEDYGGVGTGMCRIIDMGRSSDYVFDVLTRLQCVVTDAQAKKSSVVWG